MIVCLNLCICIEYVDVFVDCSFTHRLFNFLNCFIHTLGTYPSRVQWTCLPYLVSHRLHAIIVTMPKFSRFSVNQPLPKHKTAGFFWSIIYKKQRSNVPRIVFPCFSTISSSFRSKIIPPKIWNKFMFCSFPSRENSCEAVIILNPGGCEVETMINMTETGILPACAKDLEYLGVFQGWSKGLVVKM